MRITTLNGASQMLQEETLPASQLFVRFEIFEPAGEALVATTRFVRVPLDSLVALVGDRLGVLLAAGAADEKPTRAKKAVAR